MVNQETKFPALKNDLILRAAKGQIVEKVPVWIMRQAGRYLPEFKKIFSEHDFFSIVRSPELSCQLTLQPIDRFNLDAAVIFSDILVIPQSLGMECVLKPGIGPVFRSPLQSKADVESLKPFSIDSLQYVYEAITLTRHKLEGRVPVIGFTGGPWTLMSYMVDGESSKTCSKSKRWLYDSSSDKQYKLLDILSGAITTHLYKQVVAGAQLVQIFETNAGFLTPEMFRTLVIPLLRTIVQNLRKMLDSNGYDDVPISLFCKGANHSMEILNKIGIDVLSLDWTVDPEIAREFVGCTIQGNLDPCALYTDKAELYDQTKVMLQKFGARKLIANLGHGIYPDMDPEHVKWFVDAVHEISADMVGNGNQELLSLYT